MTPELIAYMVAWVRLHSLARPNGWTATEIIESFALLPTPTVPFEQWAALLGGGQNKTPLPGADAITLPTPAGRENLHTMSAEAKAAANAAYLKIVAPETENARATG